MLSLAEIMDVFSPMWTLQVAGLCITAIAAVLAYFTRDNFNYRHARFGSSGHVLALGGLIDTQAIRELHWNINTWTDEEALRWKASYISSCTAIQVAGAIFASVGLTALQLPNMDATHWSARALLTSSMMLGILSVVYASSLQQTVGMLNNGFEIRLWMSRGKVELEKNNYTAPYHLLPLESSIAAVKQYSLPKVLLNLAVLLYTIGFGLYLLYSWLYHVETSGGTNDLRNIFISFIIAVGVVVIYQICLSGAYALDAMKRNHDFSISRSTGFAKPKPRKELEEWLAKIQDMLKMDLDNKDYNDLEKIIIELKTKWETERKDREDELQRSRLAKRTTMEQMSD